MTEKLTISDAEYAAVISEADTSRSRPLLFSEAFFYKTDDLRSVFSEALIGKRCVFLEIFAKRKKHIKNSLQSFLAWCLQDFSFRVEELFREHKN